MTLTNPQSWNRYAYAVNNPLAVIDPTGLDDCDARHAGVHGMDQGGCDGDDDDNGVGICYPLLPGGEPRIEIKR